VEDTLIRDGTFSLPGKKALLCRDVEYRLVVFDQKVDRILKEVCLEISKRYKIIFLEIGTDKDHVHFLIQSVPTYSPTKIAMTVKSITAREIFKQALEVNKKLWGGKFWSKGYFMNTVGQHGNEQSIANYVKNQGNEHDYKVLHKYKKP
jgi:putative transposase